MKQPILLMILDGFGIREEKEYNAILQSNMTNYFSLWKKYPHTKLNASGPLVGLPKNQIGSSEVGHLTIGAGRLIKQPIVRINEDIESKNFLKHKILLNSLNFIKTNSSNIHILGLLGPGGVHSSSKHLYAILDFYNLNSKNLKGEIYIHNFLDGRDTPQKSALKYLKELEKKINSLKIKNKIHLSTICGRFYAMDRDKRWERTKKAYDLLVYNLGEKAKTYTEKITSSYDQKIYDEFITPTILDATPIKDNDLILFYNFRSDRPRQLLTPFLNPNFKEFKTKKFKNLKIITLTQYSEDFNVEVLYPTIYPKNTLGEIISTSNLSQLRIAESEKYPHVTYFFNGLRNPPFKNEDRIKINSPKVETYDLKPQMSASEVTKILISKLQENKYDFYVLNYANPDMVGHTGNYSAVKKALKEIDKDIQKIYKELQKINGTLIITADHGNCETMRDNNKNPHTKHTYNQVPFILCKQNIKLKQNQNKLSLFNIAPTILELLNIEKPKEMLKTPSLIKK